MLAGMVVRGTRTRNRLPSRVTGSPWAPRDSNNRAGTALFDVAGGTEETLRLLQRVRIETTGEHLARGRCDGGAAPALGFSIAAAAA